ncbi:MAG: PaaI family thioesterase [Bacillota bacterium]
MNNQEFLQMGQEILASQAFSHLVGAELTEFKPGKTVLEIPITEKLLQQHKFVHGGVLSYAADNVLTFVGGSVLGIKVLTSEFKINYLRPAIGEKLIAKGTVIYCGKRQAVCRCDIFIQDETGNEKICATAQGTIVSTA